MLKQTQENIDAWKKNLAQYKETKTKLPWTTAPPVSYVTEKEKKQIDSQYNPVLQTYNNPAIEAHVKEIEHKNFIQTLAKNKVCP